MFPIFHRTTAGEQRSRHVSRATVDQGRRRSDRRGRFGVGLVAVIGCALLLAPATATQAQQKKPKSAAAVEAKNGTKAPTNAKLDEAAQQAEAALNAPGDAAPSTEANLPPLKQDQHENLLQLWFKGGVLMIPITMMSFVVIVFGIERLLALRRRKVIPPQLAQGLIELAGRSGGFNPSEAYKLCQAYPSTAASVIGSVLLKVGRPHAELEHTMTEASEREAAKLYKNVRWISLATTLTPLLGLLGTVQGMIACFQQTANLPAGVDKSKVLAGGIYVALVTTFGGLIVAIPAAVIAHYFEGRIQMLFREIDELLMGLLPQLERYEGKLRFSRQTLDIPEISVSSDLVRPIVEPPPRVKNPAPT